MNKSKFTLSVFAVMLTTTPLLLNAAQFSGRIIGHDCAHKGEVCPIDKLDPHITLERDFVLVKSDGEYYFLPNLPRNTKVRYVLETVTVTGEVDSKYNFIQVSELSIKKGGKDRKVWSQKSQREAFRAFGSPGGYD